MRIGEVARIAGLSARAVRHYHQQGLLPEPNRRTNGYRDYGLGEAVTLVRIRCLTELGLSLAEVRDVLADHHGRELAEILAELDDELARQQEVLARRRTQLSVLLNLTATDRSSTESALSPELAALLSRLATETVSPMAAWDRQLTTLLVGSAPAEHREEFAHALGALAADPAAVARAHRLYARLEELATAPVTDPRIPPLAADLAAQVPETTLATLAQGWQPAAGPTSEGDTLDQLLTDGLSPAQAETVRRMVELLADRVKEQP